MSRSLSLTTKDWPPPVKTYDDQFYNIQKTNWNAIQLVMSPYLRLISLWCLQGLQLNGCVLTRRKSGPIETALSGHASAVLRVILAKETLCDAWFQIKQQVKGGRRHASEIPINLFLTFINSIKVPCSSRWSKWGQLYSVWKPIVYHPCDACVFATLWHK